MANAFDPRDCYQSTVAAIGRLLVDCDIDQVPSIPFDPDARAVMMTSMPVALAIGRSRRTGVMPGGCIPVLEWDDVAGDYVPVVDAESEPYINRLIVEGDKIIAHMYVSTFDTCGNFIESVRVEDEDVAMLGPCPDPDPLQPLPDEEEEP